MGGAKLFNALVDPLDLVYRYPMPFTQTAIEKEDHILFIGDGAIRDTEELYQWCVTSIEKARDCGYTRLLYDNGTLSLELSQHDIMTAGEQLADMGVQLMGLRFAVVSSAKTSDVAKSVETAFANRSAAYRRFDTKEEALQWLLA